MLAELSREDDGTEGGGVAEVGKEIGGSEVVQAVPEGELGAGDGKMLERDEMLEALTKRRQLHGVDADRHISKIESEDLEEDLDGEGRGRGRRVKGEV